MVILLTLRKSKYEEEIVEILKNYGADHFCDKSITVGGSKLTCISIYKHTELNLKNAVAIFTDKTSRFSLQKFPIGVIGVCEDSNKTALENFKKSNNAVITCGINNKNTITISSLTTDSALITLQRSVIDINGNRLEPCEFKIRLSKPYAAFSIMAATAALILNGISPTEF